MPYDELRSHLRDERELHLADPRNITGDELWPKLTSLPKDETDVMRTFFSLRSQIECCGKEQIGIDCLNRMSKEIAVNVDKGRCQALLS
jgi:hypothetical protein